MRRALTFLAASVALAAPAAAAAQPPSQTPPSPTTPGASAEPAPDAKAILEGACSMCHGVDFITSRRKDRDGWDFTVHRMMDKGASLSVEDAAALIDYLARTYPKPADPAPPAPGAR